MSFLSWLERLFVPARPSEEDGAQGMVELEPQHSPFEWNQNMRIVTAIVVTFISACVMWWIVG